MKRFLALLLAPVVLAGCSSVSNLSATRVPRTAAGWYTVEAKFSTKRQAVIDESIKAYAVIDGKPYQLQRVPLVRDRWEGQIPVDPTKTETLYHFQFDFLVNRIPKAVERSYVSSEYTLDVK
jgi:hypothetical protein